MVLPMQLAKLMLILFVAFCVILYHSKWSLMWAGINKNITARSIIWNVYIVCCTSIKMYSLLSEWLYFKLVNDEQ